MVLPRVVIDTNIVVSALRSNQGTSYALMMLVGKKQFEISLSVPLLIEYEKAVSDPRIRIPLNKVELAQILDYICAHSVHHEIHFLWRPFLNDPGDDMVLEVAVAGGCEYIVTFNKRDFKGVEQFGLNVVSPYEFLEHIGVSR